MSVLSLHNSLRRSKEVFEPEEADNVRLYVCGPTVYGRAHIGNARAMVIFDQLYRVLRQQYGEKAVSYVRNITDVDDKINKAAFEQGISIAELTEKTTQLFHDDMAALNCLEPTHEPRATAHIADMIAMIEKLIDKGYAYAEQEHVLFDVTRYAAYGRLSNRSSEEMLAGARVEVAPYKKNAGDFVLWKPSTDQEPGWDSPWGYGRPGWHIECSAMSTKYLGETFDIHGGGADLQFPHHENEIAQSCCVNEGSHYARYWVHNGFLTVGGEKMSKSLGNFLTMSDILEGQGLHGEVVRYALLSTHYRKPLDWNEKVLHDAKKALDAFYRAVQSVPQAKRATAPEKVVAALRDDLNTPKAFAELHQLVQQLNKESDGSRKAELAGELCAAGQFLGILTLSPQEWLQGGDHVNGEIEALIEERQQARTSKNWQRSDEIRDALKKQGIILEDHPDGTTSWARAQ